MPDSTRPQDVDPNKPVVDADEKRPLTPQGRTDGADDSIGPATDEDHEADEASGATTDEGQGAAT